MEFLWGLETYKKHSNYLSSYIYLYPGCIHAFEEFRQSKIRLAIVTGKDTERAKRILSLLKIHHYFDFVIGSDAPMKSKPAPDALLWIQSAWEVEISDLVFVGDALADMNAGWSAKIKTAFAHWGYGNPDTLLAYPPSFELASWEDLIKLTKSQIEATQ